MRRSAASGHLAGAGLPRTNRAGECPVAIRDNDDLSRAGTPETVGRIFDEMPLTVVAFEGAELNVVAASRRFRELTGRSDLIGLPARPVLAERSGQKILAGL